MALAQSKKDYWPAETSFRFEVLYLSASSIVDSWIPCPTTWTCQKASPGFSDCISWLRAFTRKWEQKKIWSFKRKTHFCSAVCLAVVASLLSNSLYHELTHTVCVQESTGTTTSNTIKHVCYITIILLLLLKRCTLPRPVERACRTLIFFRWCITFCRSIPLENTLFCMWRIIRSCLCRFLITQNVLRTWRHKTHGHITITSKMCYKICY